MTDPQICLIAISSLALCGGLVCFTINTLVIIDNTNVYDDNGVTIKGFWRKYFAYVEAFSSVKNGKSDHPFYSHRDISGHVIEFKAAGLILLLFPIILLGLTGVAIKWIVPALLTSLTGIIVTLSIVGCITLWKMLPYILAIVAKLGDKFFATKDKLDKLVNVVDTVETVKEIS